MKKKDKTGLEI